MNLQAIDHVALSVRDVERSAKWYVDVFGFDRQHADVWSGYPVFVGKNDAAVALFPIRSGKDSEANRPSGPRVLHFAFRTTGSQFLAAQEELRKREIRFEFRTTKSRTQSTSRIRMATKSRSRLTTWRGKSR